MCVSHAGGYNCSLLAYGQTGAGKTFSMLGGSVGGAGGSGGLIPRICRSLFEAVERCSGEASVEASYMEVYNETALDLLLPTGKPLRVRESQETHFRQRGVR